MMANRLLNCRAQSHKQQLSFCLLIHVVTNTIEQVSVLFIEIYVVLENGGREGADETRRANGPGAC